MLFSSSDVSRTCAREPMRAPQVTLNIGFTTLAGDIDSLSWAAAALEALSAALLLFGRLLNSCSDAAIISSRSLRNFSFFLSSVLEPKKPGASKNEDASKASAPPSFARASSSSFKVKGLAWIRLKIPSKNSLGRSPPSTDMPRLFRMNPSIVIRFSGLMLGLCRSVCNMITEKARMKAVSAEGNTSSFCRV